MAFNFKPNQFTRVIRIASRRYCEKTIYQRDEDLAKGEKPRSVYGQPYPEWRKPWLKRDGEWRSKFSVFIEKNPHPDVLSGMQRLPNLTFQDLKDWWRNLKVIQEKVNQKYLTERVVALGSNLAAVHFFTYRNSKVRLKNSKEWISGDILTLKLPDHYVDGIFVEAVDCTNFHHNGIRFEGLENLSGLNFLKWLSLKNNKHVDVWCLDRIAGQNGKSLEYLDISGCQFCEGCVYALARMPALKVVVLTDPGDNIEVQAALSVLEEERPDLIIKTVDPD